MRKFWLLLLFFGWMTTTMAHPWKPNHYVIIDTDAGIDDLRAICLMLANPSVRILGITVSGGSIPAEEGYQKVKSLLASFHHEGILVGINKSPTEPKYFEQARKFQWTDSAYSHFPEKPAQMQIARILKYTDEPITFINLGSLSTLFICLQENPNLKKQLKQVLWSIDDTLNTSWNYQLSPDLYSELINAKIPIKAIASGNIAYADNIIQFLKNKNSRYAETCIRSLEKAPSQYSQTMHDELVAIYLADSSQFIQSEPNVYGSNILSSETLKMSMTKLFGGENANRFQSFKKFPLDSSNYIEDIATKMQYTVSKYGETEWAACVLTNELHRHVGIYALIGAKMGIRAREYFGAGVDEMKAVSFAGDTPPISCMNDGIQVSTGATAGHGLLTFDTSGTAPEPKFTFEYLGQKVQFSLKPEYKEKLKAEVKQLASIYGLNSNVYWDLVRKIALNSWFNWDRNNIFDITVISEHFPDKTE